MCQNGLTLTKKTTCKWQHRQRFSCDSAHKCLHILGQHGNRIQLSNPKYKLHSMTGTMLQVTDKAISTRPTIQCDNLLLGFYLSLLGRCGCVVESLSFQPIVYELRLKESNIEIKKTKWQCEWKCVWVWTLSITNIVRLRNWNVIVYANPTEAT